MRPDLVNVIISKQQKQGINFFVATNTGKEMTAATLNWIFGWAAPRQLNVLYKINGGTYRIGSEEFGKLNINP